MRKQDHLVQLISVLSPNERRYFKLFSNIQPGPKRYIQLFDLLESKTDYDATALSTQLGITTKQLADDKYYLSNALLQSLRYYEEQNHNANALRRNFEEAILLSERRLFDYALEIIDRSLKGAWEMELYELIAQLLKVKLTCLHSLGRHKEMPHLLDEYNKATSAGQEIFELALLGGAINRVECERVGIQEFKKHSEHRLFKKDVKDLQSIGAKIRWFDVKFRYYIVITDGKKVLQTAQNEVKYYEENSEIKSINPIAYVVAYTRVANGEFEVGNFENALIAIQRFEKILEDRSLGLNKARIDSLKYYAGLFTALVMRKLGRWQEAYLYAKKNYEGSEGRPVYEQFSGTYDYVLALFALGKLNEALIKLEELLQMKEDIRVDLQAYLRPLLIMIQMDNGNYQLIPYLVKSARAWMKRKKIILPDAELFFKHAYSISKAAESNRKKEWLKLREAISKGKLNSLAMELNLESWIDKKARAKQ